MSKKLKITIWIIVGVGLAYILTAAVALAVAAATNKSAKKEWAEKQIERVEYLEKGYAAAEFDKIDEQTFCSFDISRAKTDGVKINRLQYLATHNSYKTGLLPATKFLYHGPLFAVMGDKYDYYFDSFTEQLNNGIRSFELDPNYAKTDGGHTVEVVHSDLLEACSSSVSFELGLKEIKMWMDYNPTALPIIILLEPKGKKSYVSDAFEAYDEIIRRTFGEKLVTPADFLGEEYASFDEFRKADAYPEIKDMQGKILFLLHDKSYVDNYIKDYKTMKEWVMFPALNYSLLKDRPETSEYSCFAISNDAADDARIRELIADGYMVRTRLDEYSVVSAEAKTKGVASGANIMSSDYPPTDSGRYDYTCYIDESNKSVTIKLRGD